jgi:hypothetical protein
MHTGADNREWTCTQVQLTGERYMGADNSGVGMQVQITGEGHTGEGDRRGYVGADGTQMKVTVEGYTRADNSGGVHTCR